MSTCQTCQREFEKLRFHTEHISICTRCVNTLNDFDEPAIEAQHRIREMLSRGMLNRAVLEQHEADEQWKRDKAVRTLNNFEQAVDLALPGWLNKLLADSTNTTKDYKQLRAQRRGLLRLDVGRQWTYPGNWTEVTRRIRARDGYRCMDCGDASKVLDVHHIIYLSKYGTNQQSNLVTLCRTCHEKVHGREFDLAEADDPESLTLCGGQTSKPPLSSAPLLPPTPPPRPLAPTPTPPLTLTPKSTKEKLRPAPSMAEYNSNSVSLVDTKCPRCQAQLRAPIKQPIGDRVHCPVCEMVYQHGVNDGINLITFEREQQKFKSAINPKRTGGKSQSIAPPQQPKVNPIVQTGDNVFQQPASRAILLSKKKTDWEFIFFCCLILPVFIVFLALIFLRK